MLKRVVRRGVMQAERRRVSSRKERYLRGP